MKDKSAKTHDAPLQPVPLPDSPWQQVGIDIVGPFDSATWDCRYAVTLTDYYKKWSEVAFTPSITTTAITTLLSPGLETLLTSLVIMGHNSRQANLQNSWYRETLCTGKSLCIVLKQTVL